MRSAGARIQSESADRAFGLFLEPSFGALQPPETNPACLKPACLICSLKIVPPPLQKEASAAVKEELSGMQSILLAWRSSLHTPYTLGLDLVAWPKQRPVSR